jgi:hypothetical protein
VPRLYLEGEMCPVRTEDDRYPVISHPPAADPSHVDITLHVPKEPRNVAWAGGLKIIHKFMEYMDDAGEKPQVRVVGQDPIEPGRSHMLKMARQIRASDLFVGPDSAGFHIAAALGVPTVASLTPKFPASMRSYPKVVAVGDDLAEVFPAALALYRKNKNG